MLHQSQAVQNVETFEQLAKKVSSRRHHSVGPRWELELEPGGARWRPEMKQTGPGFWRGGGTFFFVVGGGEMCGVNQLSSHLGVRHVVFFTEMTRALLVWGGGGWSMFSIWRFKTLSFPLLVFHDTRALYLGLVRMVINPLTGPGSPILSFDHGTYWEAKASPLEKGVSYSCCT